MDGTVGEYNLTECYLGHTKVIKIYCTFPLIGICDQIDNQCAH